MRRLSACLLAGREGIVEATKCQHISKAAPLTLQNISARTYQVLLSAFVSLMLAMEELILEHCHRPSFPKQKTSFTNNETSLRCQKFRESEAKQQDGFEQPIYTQRLQICSKVPTCVLFISAAQRLLDAATYRRSQTPTHVRLGAAGAQTAS